MMPQFIQQAIMATLKLDWKRVLADAETSIKHVYAATLFARRHISIPDQQRRSFNLCYALSESGLINDKSRVAIIGGSFSGMTCAVALAMRHDCIIHVFEKEQEQLKKFREAGFRYLHPELNDRGHDILPTEADKATDFPFMNWSADYAPLVAGNLRRQFAHYCQHTCIAVHRSLEVLGVSNDAEKVVLKLPGDHELKVDVAILATGFGDERRNASTNDASYWHSGNPEAYDPAPAEIARGRYRVLVSGNGDSAIIELAHYLLKEFNHKRILSFLPSEELALLLGGSYGKSVFSLAHRQIESGWRDFPDVAGPVSWYWWQRRRIAQSADAKAAAKFGKDEEDRFAAKIYKKIDGHLSGFKMGERPPEEVMAQIESEIQEPLLDFASREIGEMIAGYKFKNIFAGKLSGAFRRLTPVVVVGKTPTIYSARQSPMNWFLIGILERFGKLKYISGELESAKRTGRRITVVLRVKGKKKTMKFEKVVVRHGPDYRSFREQTIEPMTPVGYFRPDYGKWLLGTEGKAPKPGWKNPLIPYFRSQRWKRIAAAPVQLEQEERIRAGLYLSDQNFLALCVWGYADRAEKVYRQLKNSKTSQARQRYAQKLDSLHFSGSLGFPKEEYRKLQSENRGQSKLDKTKI